MFLRLFIFKLFIERLFIVNAAEAMSFCIQNHSDQLYKSPNLLSVHKSSISRATGRMLYVCVDTPPGWQHCVYATPAKPIFSGTSAAIMRPYSMWKLTRIASHDWHCFRRVSRVSSVPQINWNQMCNNKERRRSHRIVFRIDWLSLEMRPFRPGVVII